MLPLISRYFPLLSLTSLFFPSLHFLPHPPYYILLLPLSSPFFSILPHSYQLLLPFPQYSLLPLTSHTFYELCPLTSRKLSLLRLLPFPSPHFTSSALFPVFPLTSSYFTSLLLTSPNFSYFPSFLFFTFFSLIPITFSCFTLIPRNIP